MEGWRRMVEGRRWWGDGDGGGMEMVYEQRRCMNGEGGGTEMVEGWRWWKGGDSRWNL